MNEYDAIKEARKRYHQASEALADVVAEALLDVYKNITGKEPSTYMRETMFSLCQSDR